VIDGEAEFLTYSVEPCVFLAVTSFTTARAVSGRWHRVEVAEL
jgi:hypothetical protein